MSRDRAIALQPRRHSETTSQKKKDAKQNVRCATTSKQIKVIHIYMHRVSMERDTIIIAAPCGEDK